MTTILIVEDHPLFREALGVVIASCLDARLLHAASLEQACEAISSNAQVDLVILDLMMPDTSTTAGLCLLRRNWPHIPLLVISALNRPSVILDALRNGAMGYVSKGSPTETLAEAIQTVLRGGTAFPQGYQHWSGQDEVEEADEALRQRFQALTSQQIKVLQLLSHGRLNKQIAFELGITERTVKSHVSAILRRFRVVNRTQAVIAARRLEEIGVFD